MSGVQLVDADVHESTAERMPSLVGAVTVNPIHTRVTLWLPDGARLSRPICDGETPEQAAAKMLDALGEYIGPIAANAVRMARG